MTSTGSARPQPKPVNRIRYSLINILTGSDLSRRRLARMSASSDHEGPAVWLTACAHGDEVGGLAVVQEVFKRLRKTPLVKGAVHAFPLMNPLGFEVGTRQVAFSGEDLNRCFPGQANGSLAQRMAARIFAEIMSSPPALVLDLHNDWRRSIPYTLVDPPPAPRCSAHRTAAAIAHSLGLPVVAERPHGPEAQFAARTLSGSLLRQSVPALTLELGEAYVVNEQNVLMGLQAVWNVLIHLGMIVGDQPTAPFPTPPSFSNRTLAYSGELISTTSGILRFLVKPGEVVEAGRPAARVYNAFGKLLETIRAPQRGLVLGHCDSSVAFPGVPVVALAVDQTRPDSR